MVFLPVAGVTPPAHLLKQYVGLNGQIFFQSCYAIKSTMLMDQTLIPLHILFNVCFRVECYAMFAILSVFFLSN